VGHLGLLTGEAVQEGGDGIHLRLYPRCVGSMTRVGGGSSSFLTSGTWPL
jgi:hypothetical protein